MKKQLFTLRRGITSSVILMISLILVVGIVGYIGFDRINSVIVVNNSIYSLQDNIATIQVHTGVYQLAVHLNEVENKQKEKEIILELLDQSARTMKNIEADMVSRNGAIVRNAGTILTRFRSVFDEYGKSIESDSQLEEKIKNTLQQVTLKIEEGKFWIEEMDITGKILTSTIQIFFDKTNLDNWQKVEQSTSKMNEAIHIWYEKVNSSEKLKGVGDDIISQFKIFQELLQNYHIQIVKQIELADAMKLLLKDFSTEFSEMNTVNANTALKEIKNAQRLIVIFMVVTFFTGFAISIFLNRWIMVKMNRFISGVRGGSERLALKADQLFSVSRNLAKGSSEQASSIEEMSSSIEEVSSMTRQNADNVKSTDILMQEVRQIVGKTNLALNEMNASINDITDASEATAKIVKVIDEIAFQTNLLALNAAIEAARAGEAGAGFSVVADEVRNLASRSSEAAKNTFQLIEGTLIKVKEGTESLFKTNEKFQEVSVNSSKIAELISEVTLASNEQVQGLEQINTGIAGIDRVVQQNAADAQESADLTEELNSQSDKLKIYVEDLMGFIGILEHQIGISESDETIREEFVEREHEDSSEKLIAYTNSRLISS